MKNFLFKLAILVPFLLFGYIVYDMARQPDSCPWTSEEKAAARYAQFYPIVYLAMGANGCAAVSTH